MTAGPTTPALRLPALGGNNPLGFLAALGVLDVAQRMAPARGSLLAWSDEIIPVAILSGPPSMDDLFSWILDDRDRWLVSPVTTWGPGQQPLSDLKPLPHELRTWASTIADRASLADRTDSDLLCALVAEGAVAAKGDAKPTHLHFTAGQQRFLTMVRQLADGITRSDLEDAVRGPWRYESTLPSLGWDNRGERIYALRGFDPAGEKRRGVPGADWLAFLGLTYFPVAEHAGALLTAGCAPSWKAGSFTWPLWTTAIGPQVIRSLMTTPGLTERTPTELRRLGLLGIQRAPIRRTDQGGYGSFGPATTISRT